MAAARSGLARPVPPLAIAGPATPGQSREPDADEREHERVEERVVVVVGEARA